LAGKSFRCQLVTPAARLLDEDVTYASVPAWDGSFGVLTDRAPILARLGVGELRLEFADSAKGQGGGRSYLVEGGFVQMLGNKLTVLAERATPTESLVLNEAEAELRAAEAKSVPEGTPNRAARVEDLQKERQRARVKVQLARGKGGI
jgi:F-type H+-transporting ATPase subunit epsilon